MARPMTQTGSFAASPADAPALAAKTAGTDRQLADALRIPVVEESLEIGKRVVERGGYRLTKTVEVVEELVDEVLRARTVEVERRPVGTLLEGLVPPPSRQEGDTLVLPVVKEVLVTEKRLLLVEEICIRHVEAEYRNPQRVTLRKEEVFIERLEADPSE